MSRHEFRRFGQILLVGASESVVTALIKNSGEKIVFCSCTSIPSQTAGFAVGCILIYTTTGAIYTNTGTTDLCTFSLIG